MNNLQLELGDGLEAAVAEEHLLGGVAEGQCDAVRQDTSEEVERGRPAGRQHG